MFIGIQRDFLKPMGLSLTKHKKYLFNALKVIGWILVSFLVFFLIVSILLQFPSVQTRLVGVITSQISSRVQTTVEIDRVALRFPKSVGLRGIYLEDEKGDTLLYAESLFMDIGMWGLLKNQVNATTIELSGVVANMTRIQNDTVYNFQFLVDAFAAEKDETTDIQKPEEGVTQKLSSSNDIDTVDNGWDVRINMLRLKDIRFSMSDHLSGMDMLIYLEFLNADFSPADLLNEKYHSEKIHISKPFINLDFYPRKRPSPESDEVATTPELDIHVGELQVDDLEFKLADSEGQNIIISLASLLLKPQLIELHTNTIEVHSLDIDQLYADFLFPSSAKQSAEKPEVQSKKDKPNYNDSIEKARSPFVFAFSDIMDWDIKAGSLKLSHSTFKMKQVDSKTLNHFSPSNIDLSDINLHFADIVLGPDQLITSISNISLNFSDQFRIDRFTTDIHFAENSRLENFMLETGESSLSLNFSAGGNLLNFHEKDIYNYPVALNISNAQLKKDLTWFAPVLNYFYFNWPDNQGLRMKGDIEGTLANVIIHDFALQCPGFFDFELMGLIHGLPDTDSIYADIPHLTLKAAPSSFFSNIPDSLQPGNIQLPDNIDFNGIVKGNLTQFAAAFRLGSDFGAIHFEANRATNIEGSDTIEAKLQTSSFHVGKLLKMEESLPEPLALAIAANGLGLQPQIMSANAKISISDLVFSDYKYEPIVLNLGLRDSIASMQTAYQDENLSLQMEASYGIWQEIPRILSDIKLDYAYLGYLGFTDENHLIKTDITTDLLLNMEDFFSGDLFITNSAIASEGKIYTLPEIFIKSDALPDTYAISLRSDIANANFKGNFSPALIPDALSAHFSQYYQLPMVDSLQVDTFPEKHFDLTLRLLPDDIVTKVFMQNIDSYDTLNLTVSYNSAIRELIADINWPGVEYGSIKMEQFVATVNSDKRLMTFQTQLDQLAIGGVLMHKIGLNGSFRKDTMVFDFGFNDAEGNPLYGFGGSLKTPDSLFYLQIDPEGLLINGEQWYIPEGNMITFGKKYLQVFNFNMESQNRLLSFNTREQEVEYDYPILDAIFREIDLGRLTDFSGSDFPRFGGMFNGELSLKNFFEDPAFIADLTIDNFAFGKDTIGNIILHAENPQPDFYEVFASLKSSETDLEISGNYRTGDNAGISADANLSRLDLPGFEGLMAGALTHLEGFLSGRVQLSGTMSKPLLSGYLNINDASFRVSDLNTGYFLKSEQIVFDRQQIQLRNLALEDSAGRRASLNGNINFSDLNQLGFHLNLNSQNFTLMNVKANQNNDFSGRVLVDTDLTLSGTQNNPTVEGNLKLNEGSDFMFKIPQTNPEAIGDEGVVEFISFSDTLFYRMALQTAPQQQMMSSFEVLTANININIDRQTEVKIIIDEFAGDFLEVRGGGMLSFGIDPGGRISLSGRYEIVEGEYLLTFHDVIRRNFRIKTGSHIVWSGDPMNADVNITAIHTVRTNTRELLVNRMVADQGQTAAMRQQFPFLVYLKMRGKLEEPEISFEIDMPEEHQNALDGRVMARINQINQNESELNKQVFALLILGNFIQDNPFAALSGGDLTSTARNSASQILTQQLNRLSDRYIRGVDINIEVESFVDFENGQGVGRTELQLEVSRDFFDDRVRVTVGGNIELEDEARRQTSPGDIAGDFMVEYLLTPSGNLRLKGFRTKNYADIFEGHVIETGVALIFSRSYNRFRDLFKREEQTSAPENSNE